MSRTSEADQRQETRAEGQTGAEEKKDVPAFRAIEEHAAALGLSVPVFAAVKQARGWADGKKVDQTEFQRAVNGFLNGPMKGGN